MKKIIILLAISICGIFLINISDKAKATSSLYSDVQVDLDCAGSDCGINTLANSNTTRKLAVNSQGHIYSVFYGQNGIWVAKSVNRGQSFSVATKVSSDNSEPEIGTSANGNVYVIWKSGVNYVISKSSDNGSTWQNPVIVGQSSGNQAHMAIDGDFIYAVGQSGTTLYRSSDGGSSWATTSVNSPQVFADVHVDLITHDVYIFTDNPSVYWYVSSDRGLTLSAQKQTNKSVFFSVGALTSNGSSKYFYMAGSGPNLERINLSDETVETKTVSTSDGSTTRSLAADACGNVVSGHKSGSDLYFQYSTDSGATFSLQQLVVQSAERANASINGTNGDLMFLYEKNGNVFLTTYSGLLTGGGNCYAVNLSQTAIEFTAPGQNPSITLTNSSNSSISVDSISVTGTSFNVTHDCGTSIAPGASCSVTVSGSQQASETLTIILNGVSRSIPVVLGEIASTRPPELPNTPTTLPETEPSVPVIEQPSQVVPNVEDSSKPIKNNKPKNQLPETGNNSLIFILISIIFIIAGTTLNKSKKHTI